MAGQEGVEGVLAVVLNAECVVHVTEPEFGLIGERGDDVSLDVRKEQSGECWYKFSTHGDAVFL